MDKNQLIGWVLIVGIVIGFVFYTGNKEPVIEPKEKLTRLETEKPNEQKIEVSTSAPQLIESIDTNKISVGEQESIKANNQKLKNSYGNFAGSANKKPGEVIIENNKIRLHINTNGAFVSKAVLKEFRSYADKDKTEGELTIFEGNGNSQILKFNHIGRELTTDVLRFQPSANNLNVSEGLNSITFSLKADNGEGRIDYVYSLNADDYLLDFNINMVGLGNSVTGAEKGLELEWLQRPVSIEKSLNIERQSASVFWHSQEDGYDWLNERGPDDDKAEFKTDWISFKQQFFSNILICKGGGLNKPDFEIKYNEEDTTYLKEYVAKTALDFSSSKDNYYNFKWFFGPNDFDLLASIEDGELELENEINLGWGIFRVVNQYVLYPLFQLILEYLGVSIGIGIILLTFAIKLLLFPITYKNYLSSAKMRVIKPQLEKLNEENKDADPMKKQQATMALYKQTGVNPLAGCIPALLQMPILIALYRLFPASIELRHQGFLWADDLSSVDDFIQLGFPIPIYGDHMSLFTLLMAISMFFYMRFNQQMTPTQSGGGEMQEAIQKNMKVMMNLMPIFMLFMFNNYAAGLSFYYFLANTITIAQTITIKKFIIDEKSILAKIENQMKQPMKKSRWQKKIEEIQTKQQGK
jgi:YidC/Oxa1 family membrane protein insertase